jgi:ketosteroid isomerase-like protein
MKQMMNDPAMTLTFKASRVEVAKSGAMGYTEGSYKLTVTDPTTHKVINEHGSYATTYRQQADRTWKAVIDIVTSEVPPASSSH